jgi:hypothetical protein
MVLMFKENAIPGLDSFQPGSIPYSGIVCKTVKRLYHEKDLALVGIW